MHGTIYFIVFYLLVYVLVLVLNRPKYVQTVRICLCLIHFIIFRNVRRYRVPSSPKGNRAVLDPLRHASRTTSSSDTVDMVKRTLQSALNKTQSMFNPAYREFRFKDFSPGT